MYKILLTNFVSQTNVYGGKVLEVEKAMYYPNGYVTVNNSGNYTKHYYADDQRIASKIGNGAKRIIFAYQAPIYGNFIDTITLTIPLPTFMANSYKDSVLCDMAQQELGEVTYDTIEEINCDFSPFVNLLGDTTYYEDGLFFWHGSNIASNVLVTNLYGAVSQAILYNPWGSPILEYREDWHQDIIPEYMHNACEYDKDNKMYIMGVRYYSDDDITFRSRDKRFARYFWCSPYSYGLNNPLRFIDPTGLSPEDPPTKTVILEGVEVTAKRPEPQQQDRPVILPDKVRVNVPFPPLTQPQKQTTLERLWAGICFIANIGGGQETKKARYDIDIKSVDISMLLRVLSMGYKAATGKKPESIKDAIEYLGNMLEIGHDEIGEVAEKILKLLESPDPMGTRGVIFSQHDRIGPWGPTYYTQENAYNGTSDSNDIMNKLNGDTTVSGTRTRVDGTATKKR